MNFNEDDTDLTIREIYEWIEDESIYSKDELDAVREQSNHDFYRTLISIEEFVADVLNSDEPAFVRMERLIERNDLKITKKYIQRLPLAKYFTSVIELMERYSQDYKYTTNVELFFHCGFELEIGKEWFKKPDAYTSKEGKLAFELFNDFIGLIRIKSREAEFDGKVNTRALNAQRNFKSASEFVLGLFTRRLLILRVDLYYLTEHAHSITAEEAKADFSRFLYDFRHNKTMTKDIEGYLWKQEFGYLKGMHFHMLFFYDGSQVQNDEYWGHKIGSYWVNVITNGRGRFYNCNKKENKAKFEERGLNAIGMIGRVHDDPDKDLDKNKRDILINKIVKYFFKSDQYLLATKLGNEKGRIYGKGYGPNWKLNKA